MTNSGRSGLETDRTRPNQRRPCPPKRREAHGRPCLQRSHATDCLRRAYHEPESRSLDEAGVPNELLRASTLSPEPPQGKDVDRSGDAIVPLIQRADDQTCKRLDHVREYQVHVHHPVERPKSIEVQLCHVDDENEVQIKQHVAKPPSSADQYRLNWT
ncbi:hypothetical protein FAGAP_5255 [Fusarium agapanthi]|uniref:Uncharacterized protein n=1 Tax=Fusarium agapanthi TaxID=1803897 RepID=A0A9P5EF89_9HYPO|nr:hypothetical protein FAGAP_5255 [Fusarium agapanthi]